MNKKNKFKNNNGDTFHDSPNNIHEHRINHTNKATAINRERSKQENILCKATTQVMKKSKLRGKQYNPKLKRYGKTYNKVINLLNKICF